jgi:PAS domain S-box-containing protein
MVYAPRDKILNQPFTKFLSKDAKEKFIGTYNKILYGEKIERLELNIRNQINKNITVEMNTSPILWNEEVIGSFIIIRNIEQRIKVLEALRQSEEKFRTLTENIGVGIFRNSGPKNAFIEANPAIITMFGYVSKSQFIQLNVSDLYQNPNDRKKFIQKMKKFGFVKNEEYRFKKKNGTPFWGSVTAVAIPNEKGDIKYYDGLIEDITERKRAREEIKFYNTLVRHDISNKEQAILGYLEILRDIDPTPQQLQIIDKALGVVDRSISLIRKVSFFEKIKEQKELEILSLDVILTKSIEPFKREAEGKGIKIQHKPQGFLVRGNPLLEDMFSNLLHNSLTHSGCDTILISSIQEKGFIKVSIEDNGKGITDEDKHRIFYSHVKGKDSKGSGIGLYLVKKIAESCGGKVEIVNKVKNDFTQGSRFNVYLQQAHGS